jgi:hypothetical protein
MKQLMNSCLPVAARAMRSPASTAVVPESYNW